MKRSYPLYNELIKSLETIGQYFALKKIPLKNEQHFLLKFSLLKWRGRPTVTFMAGCHGEEPAPTITLFKHYRMFHKEALSRKVNLIIYPLINPWGFDRNIRTTRTGANCNDNWIHKKEGKTAAEVVAIQKELNGDKTPNFFVSFHEDDDMPNAFYLFTFGNRKYEKPLLTIGKHFFPIAKDESLNGIILKKGVIYAKHDGSAEDFMAHRKGVRFTACTETPSDQPLARRIRCNMKLMLKIIGMAES